MDSGNEFLRAEWFRQEVVGTASQSGLSVGVLAFCGQDNDRNVRPTGMRSDSCQDLEARSARHHEIQQDEVEILVRVDRLHSLYSVGGFIRLKTVVSKNGCQDTADVGLVVNYEDASASLGG
jgi:hypothetical protein